MNDNYNELKKTVIGHLVSVIIPTKNSTRTIGKCLESIQKQTYKNIEIILVDSVSSDDTCKIAAKYNAKVFSLIGERTIAKNFGISKSKGQFLLFIDSDMILSKNVVEECIKQFSTNNKLIGVVIPEHSIGSGFWIKVRNFERSFYANSKIEAPRFYKKESVDLVGGFDEKIVFYEESTIPQKLEKIGITKIVRIQSCIYHDENGFNFTKWIAKKKYYHNTAKAYVKNYEEWGKFQISIGYRAKLFVKDKNWKKLLRHPLLTIGLIILKGSEYLSIKF